jgi:S-adenosylmethionine:tRNA ribosyltransferase-isomerase
MMRLEEFDYTLPKDLIAQEPKGRRSASRLLVLDRSYGSLRHGNFADIAGYLTERDLLVLNETKVIPARIQGRKETGGAVEILLTERIDDRNWFCLTKGIRRRSDVATVFVGDMPITLKPGTPYWHACFPEAGDVPRIMAAYGRMPLPHYIKRETDGNGHDDYTRYQTVYAREEGSIAAPTAGLHFDEELLGRISAAGVGIARLTLHIGVGTFLLIKSEHVEEHKMHREWYSVSAQCAEAVRKTKEKGGRVIAVGTSAVRTLETVWSLDNGDNGNAHSGYTEIYIHPGFTFGVVDALITNFHLPRSTPLMLVSAFAGKEAIERAYKEAVERRYRFYSYGDAMFIS